MEDGARQRLFAEVDASVAAFDPASLTFWTDCGIEFRQALAASCLDLDRAEAQKLFTAWCAHHENFVRAREQTRFRRLREIARECDALLDLKRPRTAEENQRLYDGIWEIAEAHAPRQYRGPMATWGDDDQRD